MERYFRFINLIVMFTLLNTVAVAKNLQNDSTKFIPKGKPIVRVFANYHTDFGKVTRAQIRRAYLGYKYDIAKEYSVNLTLDVLNLTGFYEAYLKTAYLKYHKNKFSYSLGIIPTLQFKVQEKIWGYRYIQKVFSDKFALNSSADLGASAQYKFNKHILVNAIVQNGSGYKKIYSTNTYRGGLGLTVKPIESITMRLYYDISKKPEVSRQNYVAFLAYKFKNKFLVAGEYNYQTGNSFVENKNYGGYSAFARYFVNKKIELFARYDHSESTILENETTPWFTADGDYIISGFEYKPYKNIKFSVNYRGGYTPNIQADKYNSLLYFNLEFKI